MKHKRQQVAEILVSSGFGYFHQDKVFTLYVDNRNGIR